MVSTNARVSIFTGSNSRRPSRVRLRIAEISRSILAIEDLMKPSASEKPDETGADPGHRCGERLAAVGIRRAHPEQPLFLTHHRGRDAADRGRGPAGGGLAHQSGRLARLTTLDEVDLTRELAEAGLDCGT